MWGLLGVINIGSTQAKREADPSRLYGFIRLSARDQP